MIFGINARFGRQWVSFLLIRLVGSRCCDARGRDEVACNLYSEVEWFWIDHGTI
jgi:hypothetical protein